MSTAAQRVAKHRALKREGGAILQVPVRNVHLLAERLVEANLLGWHEAEDRDAIARATERMIKIFVFSEESTQ